MDGRVAPRSQLAPRRVMHRLDLLAAGSPM
jgi:hypothetical protein